MNEDVPHADDIAPRDIGRKGDLISNICDSLMTLDRLDGFFTQVTTQRKNEKDVRARIKTLSRDIRSTPAFQRNGQFDQDVYFRQVRSIFRETPQEYERGRLKSIKSGRLKQLLYRMAAVPEAETNAAYAQVLKTASKKEAAKITKEAVAQNLRQQRAVELINHCLKQLSAQVEHQVWFERVEGGANS